MPLRFVLVVFLAFIPACTRFTPIPGDWRIHAAPSVFSGSALPAIEVVPPKDRQGRSEHFTVARTYCDADFNAVTSAQRAGRYGAIVEISTESGRAFRRYLTLFRTPAELNWDGAQMDVTARFSAELGITPAAAERERSAIGDFFKYALEAIAWRGPNGEDTDVAALLAGLYEASLAGPTTQPFVARDGLRARDQRWWAELKRRTRQPVLPYAVWLPRSSALGHESSVRYPLILFLHGSGEHGDGGPDLPRVQSNGLPRHATFPFIVLMPQCPPNQYWSPYDLIALLDEVQAKYAVDPDRIYLTGLSLGGYGTWDTAIAFPDRFAAIAPVCGAGDPAEASRIGHLPTWIFHGEQDPTVPVAEARRMADALHRANARDVRLTTYDDVGHDAWTRAYATPELYAWFLRQRRGSPMAVP